MEMSLMAIDDAAPPKRLTYFEWRRWDLISSKINNLGISEVDQGNVFQAVVTGNRNNFHRKKL
jgi:hypothetical protein